MKKIIVILHGGLGNQLFEYATGLSACMGKGVDLYFDISEYDRDTLRNYRLAEYSEITNGVIKKSDKGYLSSLIKVTVNSNTLLRKVLGIIREEQVFIYEEFPKNSRVIDGYWQNINYFTNIKDILKKNIAIRELPQQTNDLLKEINACNSVAMHIRRGDYLQLDVYCKLGLDYYIKAFEYIRDSLGDLCLYVFSDDIEWCKKNLELECKLVFIDETYGLTDVEELELMKRCKNYIIANSTFSWWASWLSDNKFAIKIAPSKWFEDIELNTRLQLALLEGYIKL